MTVMNERDLFKEIAERSSDEIFVTDSEGVVLYVNEKCEQNYGLPAEAFTHKNIKDLETDLFYPSATLEVIRRKRPVEIMQKTTWGKRLFVKSRPVFDKEGKLIRIISYARDLTDMTLLMKRIDVLEKQLRDNQNQQFTMEIHDVVSQSEIMKGILKASLRVARTNTNILICGETGVGKNMLARKIHSLSDRSKNAFNELNCASLPHSVLDKELFGNPESGLSGLVERTNGGTLHLDEISEMPLELQSKLLYLIEDNRINQKKVDIRYIASTHQDIEKAVKDGRFRNDLYYRLNVIPFEIPPLRDRREDIIPLVQMFLKRFNDEYNRVIKLSPLVLNALYEYEWAGNVRELENLIQRLIITSDSSEITMDQLPANVKVGAISSSGTLPDKVEHLERQLIVEAYDQCNSSYKVAERLGISQSTAMRKIQKYITY